jgi:hypothetical protein
MMQNNIFASSAASATSCSKSKQRAAVIVDPMSTGAVLAQHLVSRGYQRIKRTFFIRWGYLCVRVLSQEYPAEVLAMVPPGCAGLEDHANPSHEYQRDAILAKARDRHRPQRGLWLSYGT